MRSVSLTRILAASFVTGVVVACGGSDASDGLDVTDDGSGFDAGTNETGTVSESDGATGEGGGDKPPADAATAAQDAGDAEADGAFDSGPPPVATCADGIQNQDETDVDCGGATCTTKCALLATCTGDGDCASPAVCVTGTCALATSKNGVKDNGETDIDCGGPNAPPCAATKACVEDTDCADRTCVFGTCQAGTNGDGLKNGTETDVDCGGGGAPKCATGKACKAGSDCIDAVCDAVKKVCTSRCTDRIKNGSETDIDCGGPSCKKCGTSQTCTTGTDCTSKVCNVTCKAASCTDGVRNQDETDIDCGGALCGKCPESKRCLVANDCASAACTGATCTAAHCKSGTKDSDESDVDCGGASCTRCDSGKACISNGDCALGRCNAGTCGGAQSCTGGGNGKNTCGQGGNGDCCETIAVEGGTIANNASNEWTVAPYRLDKYEITVGRMRAFLEAKNWDVSTNHPVVGAGAHKTIPGSGWQSGWNDRLPTSKANVLERTGPGANFGCFGGPDASTWTNNASVNDQKAANCFDWYTLAAFCEWDGGFLPTEREWQWAAQGGSENRAFAFGSAPTVPKITDYLPACGNAGDPGACANPNTYTGAAYTSTGGALGFAGQKVDAAYPAFLQAPGLYAVHGFCAFQGERACFSYDGPNASGNAAPNASHVAPPGSKLDIGRWGHADMSGNLIEWVLDNSVNVDPATNRQKTRPACVGTNCANLDYVDYRVDNMDPLGATILGDRSTPGNPAYWRNYNYDGANGTGPYDLNAQYHQDGGRVMRGGSWELHSAAVGSRYANYPVWRAYYASGARCARPW